MVLGGEEGIVDALEMLGRNAGAGVGNHRLHVAIDERGHAQAAAAGHGVFGVEQQVEKDLLQLAGVAVDGRKLLGRSRSTMTCAVLNWCSSSESVSRMTWLRSVSRNSVVEVREKLSRPLAISAARKLC